MPNVSVIMPVYNAERYIEKSLLSLLNQTLSDFEIIIIDDGSTDKSLAIINNILEQNLKNKNIITLISRENKGVAATRAEGISLAKGDYIIHIDSDDWVEHNWLQLMYETAIKNESDIVICDYTVVYNKKKHRVYQSCSSSRQENIEFLLTNKLSNSNWDKLIRRSILTKNNINFKKNFNMGEDFLFTLKALFYSQKTTHISKSLYYYNKSNQNSLTYKYSEKALSDIIKVVEIAENFLKNENYLNKIKKSLDHFKFNIRVLHLINSKNNGIKVSMNLYPETN
ncbi:TPA: glycosyltransferase family 2 protein, partial [Providencia stuartii]